jgi:hypothetical protein
MHWFPKHGKSMDTFRADVKKLLAGTTSTTTVSIYIRTGDGKQIGAYSGLAQAVKDLVDKNPGYKAYDKTGAVVYPAPPDTDTARLAARLQRINAELQESIAGQAEEIGRLKEAIKEQSTKLSEIRKLTEAEAGLAQKGDIYA